ncbi:protein-(glutamine-N5) methyltransferase, release factor-specific [Stanieria cyanosphaera PCC 7437]|uniref:Release factor glutamine methyltransferase n=1 Tax=Stanieria cyanosphaera (strain ATCC 29371 / PCC 7437) TaxID=111780 RepID=K9Y051_STAC7|nr:peptide chain release factor N(5)-glutamine methyltransferase [Stanieria cyanosphaera]AFZ37322.1 protein-(glutamine-N5) methyltransferase, release factor-specific [Stanieria cyanosphaera PCC 7437]
MLSGQELYLWRKQAQQEALAAKVSPQEVDWLLQELLGLSNLTLRLELFCQQTEVSSTQSLQQLTDLWQKRLQDRLPIQYLVGRVPWRYFHLKVSAAVLIPRPETELMIDFAQQAIENSNCSNLSLGNWVDLGTGSGAIALGLASILPQAKIHAVDVSEAALAIAKENAENLGFSEQISFYQGNWWYPLPHLRGKVSGMVSNPPYIPTDELEHLQPEVFKHEPLLALDGGADGLDHIRYLVQESADYLHSGGIWLIEMMIGQAPIVAKMLSETGNYHNIQIFSDLAGIERFVLAYRC